MLLALEGDRTTTVIGRFDPETPSTAPARRSTSPSIPPGSTCSTWRAAWRSLASASDVPERSRPLLPRVRGLLYGGDYNPEQWPEEIVARGRRADARGEREPRHASASSRGPCSSPSPGVYDFGWLDRIIDLLSANGVAVDLATPTAAPPAWLVRRASGGPARHARRRPARVRQPAPLLPQLAGLPGGDASRIVRAARPPLRQPPGARDVAREQRVRLPHAGAATADRLGAGLPWLAASARYGEVEALNRGLGDSLLGPALSATGRRSSRRGGRRPPSNPDAGARLGAVLARMPSWRATRPSGRCSTELGAGDSR